MNWQYKTLVFIAIAISTFSCKKKDNDEIKLQPLETVGAFFVDTFSVKAFSVQKDSTVSSHNNISSHLVGVVENLDFGKITAATFSQLNLPSGGVNFSNGAVLDSVKLSLWKNYYYGAAAENISILVNKLDEQLVHKQNDVDNRYYSFNTIQIGESLDELIYDSDQDSIVYNLSDQFSNTLFNLKNGEISSQEDFNTLFAGITLQPYQGNGVIGFNLTKSFIRIYYSLEGQNLFEDFYLNSEVAHFNRITTDRSETDYSTLISNEASVSSNDLNNKVFIQAGTRVEGELEFTSLNKALFNTSELIYKAELEIPVSLFEADGNNQESLNLIVKDSSGLILDIQKVALSSNKYTFEMTEQIQRVLAGEIKLGKLEIFVSQFGHKVYGFYIENPEENVKLKVYFNEN